MVEPDFSKDTPDQKDRAGSPRQRYIIKATFGYAIFAALWIFLSDALLAAFIDVAQIQWLSTAKGILFVVVTALLLFLALRSVPGESTNQTGLAKLESVLTTEPVNRYWIYAVAIVLSLVMLLMRSHIAVSFAERPLLILFVFPIAISAGVGGFGPGFTATVICAAGTAYSSIPPVSSFWIHHPHDLFQWTFLIINGVIVSLLCEGLHRARRQTDASRQLQVVTLASISDGVITTDRNGRITFLNTTAEQLTGWPCSEAIGQSLSVVFKTIDLKSRQPVEFPFEEVLITGAAMQMPKPSILQGRNNHEYPIQESGAPLRLADGTIAGVVLVFRDDTQRQKAEKILQQSEATYRSLFDNMLNGFAYCRMIYENGRPVDFIYLKVNQAFETLTGLKNITGRKVSEVIAGIREKDRGLLEIYDRVARGGGPQRFEILVESLNMWFSVSAYSPVQEHFVAIFDVINERKNAETALRDSEKRFRDIAEISADWIWEVDSDSRYTFASENVQTILGYPLEEIIGKTPFDFMSPENRDQVRRTFSQFSSERKSFRDLDNINLRKDGTPLHILTSGVPILDENGALKGYRGLDRDITLRKQTEQALLDSEHQFRMIVENSRDIIYTLSTKGDFLFVSPAIRYLLGYEETQLTGCPFRSFLHPDDVPVYEESFRRAIEEGGRMPAFDYRIKHAEGEWRWHTSRGAAVLGGNGEVLHFQGVARDITEHRVLEEQLRQAQKMESVGRLAGGVAHDYNNMLSVIIGYAEFALEKVPPDDLLHDDLKEILNAAQRSADITRQLLAFARKQTIAPRILEVNETVETALKMLRRLIGEDVDLAWLPVRDPWLVKIDPAQIHQILANLCINSRDAIEGVGTITIETRNIHFDERFCAVHAGFIDGDFVMLAISDDGCGMDQETRSHIFEPFFTTKQVGQGTGLGLATVYGIVQQNHGFINVNSEPGAGTTFQIFLPRHTGPVIADEKTITTAIPQGHGETILVVEDERAILELLRKMIEMLGYTPLVTSSPSEALRLAEKRADEIQLLITDVVMPEMDGKELAARLSALCSRNFNTIFVSGYTADVIAFSNTLEEGVMFIQKPFSKKDLAEKIRLALEG